MRILKITECSMQNGYYSSLLDIWYDDKEVIHCIDCHVVD